MSKRISISVPDELYEKMQEYQQAYNFSKVFQDAISQLIQAKENFKKNIKEDQTMNEVIERLKKEKTESKHEYFDRGKNDGLKWAKCAHYKDIQYALNLDIVNNMPDKNSTLFDYFNEAFQEDDLMDFETNPFHGDWANEHAALYVSGWIEGVEEFWEEVSEKVEEQ